MMMMMIDENKLQIEALFLQKLGAQVPQLQVAKGDPNDSDIPGILAFALIYS